ncbi:hypothetical protein CBER1_06125 [Cercospora berteroae]|uniref:Carrier domain-containing protein n=1 Tax=Cercospora berteroae TaxID=357750 RepID=A0A2S6C3M6_9PEZI|nr:hypothetical protein CBER1_06125 [Cercospora berteroae]
MSLSTPRFCGESIFYLHSSTGTSKQLILSAWALLLRCYLATDLIAFASVRDADLKRNSAEAVEHGNRTNVLPASTTHSLEIPSQTSIQQLVKLLSDPSTEIQFCPQHLVHFNTVVVFQGGDITHGSPVGSETSLDIYGEFKAELFLIVTTSADNPVSTIQIRAMQHQPEILQNLLQTYQRILDEVSGKDNTLPIDSLDPLTTYDLRQIRHWNGGVPKEVTATIPAIFAEHARSRPNDPAVCAWDGNLTYATLDFLSTKLAQLLIRLGVAREVIVPYGFEKSVFAVVATLAILKAGGAFVPLDSNHPQERLRSVVDRTASHIILASKLTAPSFEFLGLQVVQIDEAFLDSLPGPILAPDPLPAIFPGTSAFILLTSGTTGQPKCIVVEHSAVCTLNEAYGEALFLSGKSRVLNFAAYTFDVSTVDMFATLHHGGCICIPSEQDRKNDLTRVIQQFQVNWVDLTPSFALASIPDPKEVPSLKTLVLAGEVVEHVHVAHFVGKVDRVINCYGPAEAGGCLAKVYRHVEDEPQIIGRALSSARCWIVAVENPRRLVPIGAIGELIVEGPALSREYLKDPQKTAAAFAHHDLARLQEEPRRFYHTGDLVRYTPDGEMEFIGRRDTRGKIRGQSIELTEIEHRLSQHALLEKCLIVLPESGMHAKKLVAVIQLRAHLGPATPLLAVSPRDLAQSGFSSDLLTDFLLQHLAPYMIDRKKINDWVVDLSITSFAQDMHSPPLPKSSSTALELSSIVSKILSNGDEYKDNALCGRDFGLASAGIDSIQTVTLSKKIKQKYGVHVLVDDLIRSDMTITGLDQKIAALQARDIQTASSKEHPSNPIDFREEISSLARQFEDMDPPIRRTSVTGSSMSHVLLTGATGFLGIEILRQLLCMSGTRKVFVHVRAPDVETGLERVVAAAKKSKWWSSTYSDRLEVWLGDLTHPKLGLSDAQWDRIIATSPKENDLNAIIHNGAKVDWNLAYSTLRLANTMSTVALLNGIAKRSSGLRFVYVSGGQALQLEDEDEQDMIERCAQATGYSQSKIVSEILVRRFARSCSSRCHSIHVVKPSFVIGEVERGIANPDDYIWRLTKTAVQLEKYNRGELENWLFVADVSAVARFVRQACTLVTTDPVVIKVLDGVWMRDFWNAVKQETRHNMVTVDDDEWWQLLVSDVRQRGAEHCLWALQDILKPETGTISSTMTALPTKRMMAKISNVMQAIRRNLRYLQDELAFLPPQPSHRAKL